MEKRTQKMRWGLSSERVRISSANRVFAQANQTRVKEFASSIQNDSCMKFVPAVVLFRVVRMLRISVSSSLVSAWMQRPIGQTYPYPM